MYFKHLTDAGLCGSWWLVACGLKPMCSSLTHTSILYGYHAVTANVSVVNANNIWKKNDQDLGETDNMQTYNWEAHLSPELLSVGSCRISVGFVVRFEMKTF